MSTRETRIESTPSALPEGFMPGNVAPFVMRYGTDFLVAMHRASRVDPERQEEAEPA